MQRPDITLIFPSSPFLLNPTMFPPLGIMYLSAYLKIYGLQAQCLDMALGHTPDMAESDIIGLSFTTPQRDEAYKLAQYYTSIGKTVIAGGPHPTHMKKECSENNISKVIKGYGEIPLAQYLLGGDPNKNSLYAANTGHLFTPFPDRDALPIKDYYQEIEGRPSTPIIASRGCPYKCLSGNTLVNTIDGKIPIKNLVGKIGVRVLTRDKKTGTPLFAPVSTIAKTGINKKLVRVLFDNGEFIDCTPDHRFKGFNNGNQFSSTKEYDVEAQNLQVNSSVRAIHYEDLSGRRILVWGRNKRKLEHRLITESFIGRDLKHNEFVHHIDENPLNNDPENLKLVLPKTHSKLHGVSERMKLNNPAKNMNDEWRRKIGIGGTGIKRTEEQRVKYRNSKLGVLNPNYKHGNTCGRESRIEINHKIISVTPLEGLHDTYCLEVPGYDWFYAEDVLVHNCSFCSKISKKFYVQGAERTILELEHLESKYGFRAFSIYDDTIAVDKNRLSLMANRLQHHDYRFRCFCRADLLGDERVCLDLAMMGVTDVGIGIESGSDLILKLNMKRSTKNVNTIAVKNLQKYGIRAKAFLIVGLPGETRETVHETEEWIEFAKPEDISVSIFQPLPGSDIFNNPKKWEIQFEYNGNPMWYRGTPGQYSPTTRTKELTVDEIIELRDQLEGKFKCNSLLL